MLLFALVDKKKDLRTEYPELLEYSEFKNLGSKSEMLFVWAMANTSSPYYKKQYNGRESIKKNIEECYDYAFGVGHSPPLKEEYISQRYQERVKVAMVAMEKFRPMVRMRAKLMAEKAFVFCEEQIRGDSITAVQKLAIITGLPSLILKIEHGFGVTGATEQDEKDMMENYMDQASSN